MGTLRAHESVNKKYKEPPISSKHGEEFEAWVRQRRENFSPPKFSQETQTEFPEVLASPENKVEHNIPILQLSPRPYIPSQHQLMS